MKVLSETRCQLGEGAFWHPERQQLFWFDILGRRLLTIEDGVERHWEFSEHVSAAGWVDARRLLIASDCRLMVFDPDTGRDETLCPLDADTPATRSNDGRADPWGGFWIGTMGLAAERGAGAIWRWHKGQVTRLFDAITIPNAICFAPDRSCAYFTDTMRRRILRQPLAPDNGTPLGEPQVFVDLRAEGLNPDGAVVDVDGCLWNAQWGAGRVARYAPDGRFLSALSVPASQVSCPGFGGPVLNRLYITTAAIDLSGPEDGKTFVADTSIVGQAEHRVVL